MKAHGYGYPIVQLNLKYVRPARFRQKIRVEVSLVEYQSSIRFDYTIVDIATGQKLTVGSTTQATVEIASQEMQFQTPQSWQSAVENYPEFIAEQ